MRETPERTPRQPISAAKLRFVENLRGYVFGCACVVLAVLFTRLLERVLEGQISPLFFAAVAVSAWYGGLGPALAATTLAGVATAFVFMPPEYSLRIGWDELFRLGAFLLVGVLISSLNEKERRARQSLVDAYATAAAANHAKDEFLAVLSHELRNPLNALLNAVTVAERQARDAGCDDGRRELLAVIRRNAELETRLIDDLLDLTRLSKGKLTISKERVDAHDVVRHAMEVCARDAENKDLKVYTHFYASESVVHADPARLEQVIWNLLRNSVKFTPRGGCITIRSFNVDEGALRVEIADTGIGISRDALPKVFSAFEQGDADITRRFGGLGLGLSICRRLVELHGGRISAYSEGRGRGATFAIELPVRRDARHAEAPDCAETASTRPEALTPPRRDLHILLVEDHADTAMLLHRLLEAEGHRVTCVGGVTAALAAAAAERFDIVISDIGLPDGNGRELMQRLRAAAAAAGDRIPGGIALSGYGTDRDVRRSIDAGFATHLVKPVDFDHLAAAIQQVGADHAVPAPDRHAVRLG
jgi:signal transduction histidine kinase/ActR/RegA family two-component response regulator